MIFQYFVLTQKSTLTDKYNPCDATARESRVHQFVELERYCMITQNRGAFNDKTDVVLRIEWN
jgi:hypothetical protein